MLEAAGFVRLVWWCLPCGKQQVAHQSCHDSTTNKYLAPVETTANIWVVLETAGVAGLVSSSPPGAEK